MKALSEDSNNTVINVVRSVDAAKAKAVAELPDRTQAIHFVHGDLDDYKTLEKAAADVATITGGAIDVLIVNGGVTAGGEKLLSEECVLPFILCLLPPANPSPGSHLIPPPLSATCSPPSAPTPLALPRPWRTLRLWSCAAP